MHITMIPFSVSNRGRQALILLALLLARASQPRHPEGQRSISDQAAELELDGNLSSISARGKLAGNTATWQGLISYSLAHPQREYAATKRPKGVLSFKNSVVRMRRETDRLCVDG